MGCPDTEQPQRHKPNSASWIMSLRRIHLSVGGGSPPNSTCLLSYNFAFHGNQGIRKCVPLPWSLGQPSLLFLKKMISGLPLPTVGLHLHGEETARSKRRPEGRSSKESILALLGICSSHFHTTTALPPFSMELVWSTSKTGPLPGSRTAHFFRGHLNLWGKHVLSLPVLSSAASFVTYA